MKKEKKETVMYVLRFEKQNYCFDCFPFQLSQLTPAQYATIELKQWDESPKCPHCRKKLKKFLGSICGPEIMEKKK